MIDSQVKGVLLAFIISVGVLAGGSFWWEHRTVEAFSELGLLGPTQQISGYPSSVVVNQTFNLYLYVGNHEGHLMYYDILAKVGSNDSVVNDTAPLPVAPFADYRVVLADNQTLTEPLVLSVNRTGTNLKLVFEMWSFDSSAGSFTYHGRWNLLLLNVTAP
jgi:uncharacterized membrane protein